MTRLARLATLFLGLAVSLVAVPATHAQDIEVRAALARMAGDLPGLEARFALRFKALPASHLRLLAEHTGALLAEDEFVDLVIDVAKPLAAANQDSEAIMAKSAEVAVEMQVRGLARLSSARQEEFLRYSEAMFRWLAANDAETCKAVTVATVLPAAIEMQRIEYDYIATLPVDAVKDILGLYREAILAELREVPVPLALTQAQRDAAMFAYSNRVMAALKARNYQTLSLAALDLTSGSADEVCDFTVLSMTSVFELTGNERVWLLQEFVESMDEPL